MTNFQIYFSKNFKNYEMRTYPTGQLGTNSTFLFNNETKKILIFDGGHQEELSSHIIDEENFSVEKIIHTHAHFDHALASAALCSKYHAENWMHKKEEALYQALTQQAMMFGIQAPAPGKIDYFFKADEKISFKDNDDISFRALFTPGHTTGGTCFYTEDFGDTPILIAGDTLFQSSVGRTDLPGGDHQQLLDSIKNEILSLPDETIVICGHGPTTTVGIERKSNPFLQGLN